MTKPAKLHIKSSAKTWLHSGLQPQKQLLFWPQVSVSCLQHAVCYSILPTPKGLSHAFMETPLPSTELVQMGLGINSAFVQLLTRRRKLLRQARLEPVASGAHSTASFHWDKAEYSPWSTLLMLILLWVFLARLWAYCLVEQSWFMSTMLNFSVWSCILKPHFHSCQNILNYWLSYMSLEEKGPPRRHRFSGRLLNWKFWLYCG